MYKRALVSVSDKNHLESLAKILSKMGTEVVSTGGSAQALKALGLNVIEVSELTGFPEVMDGRVKTLHPKIHMGLLARQDHQKDIATLNEHNGILFDLVVVNLYPFEETLKKSASLKEQIENIDIGGPTLLRAASKSYDRITVLSHPDQYSLIEEGEVSVEQRRKLAAVAFSHVSSYDSLVAKFLSEEMKNETSVAGRKVKELRYGENPHQKAWWYSQVGSVEGWHRAEVLQGKELSYNNLLDLDAAQTCLSMLGELSCVVVKHNNPCGVARGKSIYEAIDLALKADPLSCFGGIVAVNSKIDRKEAERLSELFLECVVAPEVSEEAMAVFKKKKNQRVLISPRLTSQNSQKFISIWGGVLFQTQDQCAPWEDWKVVGEPLSEEMKAEVAFSWTVCANLKSNAIALTSGMQTIGLGMGQVSRVDAVEQAIQRFKKFHPESKNIVAASDAFFPFSDSVEMLAEAGVRYVIQPGGSIKDEEVLHRAQELGVTTILTGRRHFRH